MQHTTPPGLDWLWIAGEVVAIVGVIGGAAAKWFHDKLNGLGERHDQELRDRDVTIEENKLKLEELATLVSTNEKKILQSEFDRHSLHQNIGRLEGMLEQLMGALSKRNDAHEGEYRETRDRLANIEAKMDGVKTLEESMKKISGIMEQRERERRG